MNLNFILRFLWIVLFSISCAAGAGSAPEAGEANSGTSSDTGSGGTGVGTETGTGVASGSGGSTGANNPIVFPDVDTPFDLTVRENAGIARTNEVVRTGVPMARSENLLNTNSLAVVDANNQPIPAQFRILARWNAGLTDTTAPIQWLLVSFPANVSANGTSVYRLVVDGSVVNPLPVTSISVARNGNQITVNTGVATFRLGLNVTQLFDSVILSDGTVVISGGSLTGRVGLNGSATVFTNTTHTNTARRIYIEDSGPLSAAVVVEGTYDHAQVGGGSIGSVRRYVFSAGSPTAIIRHAVKWEGTLCDSAVLDCGGGVVNGLRVGGVRDTLNISTLAGTKTVQVVGARNNAMVQAVANSTDTASLRQTLRANRNAARNYRLNVPGQAEQSGATADGGVLSISGTNGSVAIALNHMHRYEPQALRLLSGNQLAVDVVDVENGQAWLGNHQGLFATMAVSALPSGPTRNSLDALVWAPLNAPMYAWPSPEWFRNSYAVDEFPVGDLPNEASDYDTFIPGLLNNTLSLVDNRGLNGLMTFGVFVRYWGPNIRGEEINCGDVNDNPTPGAGQTWDDLYWCGVWTDYHNNSMTAAIWAMRSGQTQWLDELTKPAALRVLHTQVMQCSPTDNWFYCGQAPSGYRGYRSDFNSSHAYFENLFMYYWLTGDSTVPSTIIQGGNNMRNFVCAGRNSGNGPACGPTVARTDFFGPFTGRAAMQWTNAFRFLGLASDGTYLDDYRSNLARAVTQNYLQVSRNGTTYGFWVDNSSTFVGNTLYNYVGQTTTQADAGRTGTTDQLWMASLYDMNMLYRLQIDTEDAPIGSPAVRPSQVIQYWTNTLQDYGSTLGGLLRNEVLAGQPVVLGDGTAFGRWPNTINFQYSGNRIGGTLVSITPTVPSLAEVNAGGGYDSTLYEEGKACLSADFYRSVDAYNDSRFTPLADELISVGLTQAQTESQNGFVLNKQMGINLSRLHSAIGRMRAP